MGIEDNFHNEVRVNVPGLRKYRGYSDLVPTFCCSSQACYYVVFPALGYEGYFGKFDVEVKENGGD